jgi:hypothetical protein
MVLNIQKYTVNNKKKQQQQKNKEKMYRYTTNGLNVEVNRNYTHRCSFRTSTLSNLELLWGDRKHMSDIF